MPVTEYHFGVSWASLLPHTLSFSPYFNGSVEDVCTWLEVTKKVEFWQSLPLRGVDPSKWYCRPEWSWYKEDAWNAVDTFGQAFHHEHGAANEPSNWLDWAIFPDTKTASEIFAKLAGRHVSHDFDGKADLVEIKPGHGMSARRMVEVAEAGGYQLCFDTRHALEDCHDGSRSPLGYDIVDRLAAIDEYAHLVRLVHLKGTAGLDREAAEHLARCTNLQPRIDICIETVPNPHASLFQALANLSRDLNMAKRIFKVA